MKRMILTSLTIFFTIVLSACSDITLSTEELSNIDETSSVSVTISDDAEINSFDEEGWGSVSALDREGLTIEEMLIYAIEDEFTARTEYEYIIENFDVTKPFTNIIEAEKSHIEMIIPFLLDYNLEVPFDDSRNHLIIPTNLEETFAAGVEAEILNISMYNMFLESQLPDDVVDLFTALRDASIKHLSAFEKNLAKF